MSSPCPKHYAERAIQTDTCNPTQFCTQSLDSYDITSSLVSFEHDISLGVEKIAPPAVVGDYTELEAQNADSAYTQSPTFEYAVSSCQARKQLDIGSGRPSTFTSPERRVVSLPINSGAVDILVQLDKQIRVVSMPELSKIGSLQSIHSGTVPADTSDSTDIAYNSVESCQGFARRDRGSGRPYPVDLPQTPSPPSSPDSIMIIANEGQVSGSFLRRSCTDEAGWISWASSPPRPIPALHGPLSLPYARCPSGAEGTVTEGDDLSNKIWGLGIDDTQGQHSRTGKTLKNQVIPQQGNSRTTPAMLQPHCHDEAEYTPPTNTFPREHDAVIDLSKPLVFRNQSDLTAASRYRYELDYRQVSSNFPATRDILLERPTRTKINPQYANPIDIYNPQHVKTSVRGRGSAATPLGLGLNFNGALQPLELLRPSDSFSVKNDLRTRLNTSAPVFIPAGSAYLHSDDNTGPLYAGQRDRHSKMNIASHETQQDYHLATPPSTVSPRWSPMFSHEPTMAEQVLPRNTQQSSGCYAPKIYSPHLDLDGYANRLRAMMERLGGLDMEYDNQRLTHHTDNSPSKPDMTMAHHQPRNPFEYNNISNLPHDLVVASPKAPICLERTPCNESEIEQSPRDMNVNNVTFSSERRRNLSYQHPRSIPLARLIQRRLSSVVEEDSIAQDSLLPLLRKRAYQFLNEPTQSPQSVNAEENVESAVSLEDPLLCPEKSSAIVKLPKKKTVLHLAGDNKKGKKASGSRKENPNATNAQNSESVTQGRYKHRKSGTPPLRPAAIHIS